jgi:hypothetical protein
MHLEPSKPQDIAYPSACHCSAKSVIIQESEVRLVPCLAARQRQSKIRGKGNPRQTHRRFSSKIAHSSS